MSDWIMDGCFGCISWILVGMVIVVVVACLIAALLGGAILVEAVSAEVPALCLCM